MQFLEPYQVATDVGVKIFLPARYAEEIKNIKQMGFKKAVEWVSVGLGKDRAVRVGNFAESQTQRSSSLDTRASRQYIQYRTRMVFCRR